MMIFYYAYVFIKNGISFVEYNISLRERYIKSYIKSTRAVGVAFLRYLSSLILTKICFSQNGKRNRPTKNINIMRVNY